MKSIEKRTSSAIIVVFSPAQILKRKEAKSGVSIFGPKKKKGGKKRVGNQTLDDCKNDCIDQSPPFQAFA